MSDFLGPAPVTKAGLDAAVTAKINTPGSAVATALSATYGKVVKWSKYGTNAAALVSAATEAGIGGTVIVEKAAGPYTLASAVTLTEVSLKSDGATINATALGSGVAALKFTSSGTNPDITVSGFNLMGPGTRVLGVKNANVDGIEILGSAMPKFRDIRVDSFDNGFLVNNESGHIYWDHCNVTNNYVGVYFKFNTYDYFFKDCKINGNTFANVSTSADQGIAGASFRDCHFGFAPYGFYQEATPINQGKPKIFLQEVILDHCRFEQIGNAAIHTDAQQDGTNASITSNLRIIHPGFSWSPASGGGSYKIAANDRNYAVTLSQTDRLIEVIEGANPFTTGTLGTYRVKLAGHAAFIMRGGPLEAAVSKVTIDSGAPNVYAYATPPQGAPVQTHAGAFWYSTPGTRSTGSRPNAYMTLIPFRVDQAHTYTALACEVTTAGSAGALIRLGVYSDSSGKPGDLVLDAGTIDATTTGLKSITGLSMTLQPGWYFLAAVTQGAPTTVPIMRAFGGGQNVMGLPIYTSGDTSLNSGAGWANSAVSGALPTPSGATVMTDTAILVAVKA